MNKLYNYGDIIKQRVFENSMLFFSDTKFLYDIDFEFSRRKFLNFINDFYDIYEYKKKVYAYENDISLFLSMTLKMCLNNNKKVMTLDDIYDGIWELEIQRKEKKETIETKELSKIKKV